MKDMAKPAPRGRLQWMMRRLNSRQDGWDIEEVIRAKLRLDEREVLQNRFRCVIGNCYPRKQVAMACNLTVDRVRELETVAVDTFAHFYVCAMKTTKRLGRQFPTKEWWTQAAAAWVLPGE